MGALATIAILIIMSVNVLCLRELQRLSASIKQTTGRLEPAQVLLIGDSILESIGNAGQSTIRNTARPGARAVEAIEYALEYIHDTAATRAIIIVGINDLRYGDDASKVASSLITSVKRLKSEAGVHEVIMVSILPVVDANPILGKATNREIDRVNTYIGEAARRGEVKFIDISSLFRDTTGLRSELTYDGLHLNGSGRDLLRHLVVGLTK